MIKSAVISMMPTIFMAMAITSAISSMKRSRVCAGFMPSASATSSLTVDAISGRQSQTSAASTKTPPPQISAISVRVTARMSPNRKAIRSILTQVMKATSTRPIAKAEWERMPSSASADSDWRLCSARSSSDTTTATPKTAISRLIWKNSDSATPSSAECAIVSPK